MGRNRPQKTIAKEKLKEVLDIMDVAHAFSGQVNEKPAQPLILCPFHNDKHLGSCRVYTDSQTFYCESCGTHGDALKLAAGYMGIPLSSFNELLEAVVVTFGINRDSVTAESSKKPSVNKKDLLSVEGYQLLNFGRDYYEIPAEFEEVELENGKLDYCTVRHQKIYFRSLAMRSPREHDWTICAITRWPWFQDKMYIAQCIMEGRRKDCVFAELFVKLKEELLEAAVLDKKAFRKEMSVRKKELRDMLVDAELWPSKEDLLRGA